MKFYTCFTLTNVYKRVCRIFLFCLDLELFTKIKRPGFYTLRETRFLLITIFINISRAKQNKKNPEHHFVDVIKKETWHNFSKEY